MSEASEVAGRSVSFRREPGDAPTLVCIHGSADWTATNHFDRMSDVGNIAVPALIITGTADLLTPPKYAEYLHTQIPRSELLILEGAGHMFLMERADEVARAIRTFLSTL